LFKNKNWHIIWGMWPISPGSISPLFLTYCGVLNINLNSPYIFFTWYIFIFKIYFNAPQYIIYLFIIYSFIYYLMFVTGIIFNTPHWRHLMWWNGPGEMDHSLLWVLLGLGLQHSVKYRIPRKINSQVSVQDMHSLSRSERIVVPLIPSTRE